MAIQTRGFRLSQYPQTNVDFRVPAVDLSGLGRGISSGLLQLGAQRREGQERLRLQEEQEAELDRLDRIALAAEGDEDAMASLRPADRRAAERLALTSDIEVGQAENEKLSLATQAINAGMPVGQVAQRYGEDTAASAVAAVEQQMFAEQAAMHAKLQELRTKQLQAEADMLKANTDQKRAEAYAKKVAADIEAAKVIKPEAFSEGVQIIETEVGFIVVDRATGQPISKGFLIAEDEPADDELDPVPGFEDAFFYNGQMIVKGEDGKPYRIGTFNTGGSGAGFILGMDASGKPITSTTPTEKPKSQKMATEIDGGEDEDIVTLRFEDLQ